MPWRVVVVELDDEFGPRRRADRPNVYVGLTNASDDDLDEALASATDERVRRHAVRLRPDLHDQFPPAATKHHARRQKKRLTRKLRRRAYVVNGDPRVWRLYVIELDGAQHDVPCVYVGQSSKTPEERFAEHVTGARNAKGPLFSKKVFGRAVRLRPDLYEDEPALYSADDAVIAERLLAERLESMGYSVKGGR